MGITAVGNVAGPEGVFKTFDNLAVGGVFVYSLVDVDNGVAFIKNSEGKAVNLISGNTFEVEASQLVIEVEVNATVTI